jgi:hypothetical protein
MGRARVSQACSDQWAHRCAARPQARNRR